MPKRKPKLAADDQHVSELMDLPGDPRPKDLRWRYAVGRCIHATYPERHYGQKHFANLRDLTKNAWSVAEFRKMRDFARKFSEKKVETLLKRRKNRFRFTWTHISCLVALDAKKRDKLQKQCLKEQWPAEQLRDRIRSELGKRSRGGPKHKDAGKALAQLVQETDQWLRRYESIWFEGDEAATNLALLDVALEQSDQLAEVARQAKSRLKKLQNELLRESPTHAKKQR